MRQQFSTIVEEARNRNDPRFATKTGDRFGLFRINSPTTGATLLILVGGGERWNVEGMAGEPWDHVSVSTINKPPIWQDMCFVKELFFDDEETVIQYHPAKSKYIDQHPNVLHMWRPCETPIPMPPLECV